MVDKTTMRRWMIEQLKAQDAKQKLAHDTKLTTVFLKTTAYQTCQTLAIFLSMPFEFDTSAIIERALEDGKQVLVPKTFSDGSMAFLPYIEDQLTISSFGIKEPSQGQPISKEEIDLILVPGLMWNERGYRIGFGAGFYDRYLQDFSGRTYSLVYPFQRREFEEEPHDIAVEEVIYGME